MDYLHVFIWSNGTTMKNNLKWFCSILWLSAFPFPPQGSAFPVIHVLFKSVNHLPSFTDALRTCLIGQVCGMSGKLVFNLPNPEVFMSRTCSKAVETLLSGRTREGFLCFLRAARGMDWMRPGEIECQVGTSIHPGLCHLSLLSALELNPRLVCSS